jgi:DNA-directed RNA polymerase specialized sigma24 family protein
MDGIEQFFRSYYKSICWYCAFRGHNYYDAEEIVSDVIFEEFENFKSKGLSDKALISWINRQSVYRLITLYKNHQSKFQAIPENYDPSHIETPEEIVSVMQRVPQIPQLLIDYDAKLGVRNKTRVVRPDIKDQPKYSRARRKFLAQLAGA